MSRNLYQEVTDRILAELEAGAAPWVKPWSSTPGQNVPQNAVTGRPYSGINVILLWIAREQGWKTPRFLTFKQAKEAGGHVRKGEKGTRVYFFKQLAIKDRNAPDTTSSDEATKVIPLMREFVVFNVDQVDDLPAKILAPKVAKVRNNDERDATIDEFVAHIGADIREGHGEAYFAPGADFISMPAFKSFNSAATFYGTELHELTHWSGHKSRLDRDFRVKGSVDYAAEELVAELGAAFMCAEFDIDGELRHAGYIASWIKLLKDDQRAFLKCAAKAQKAVDYLRGLALAEPMKVAA